MNEGFKLLEILEKTNDPAIKLGLIYNYLKPASDAISILEESKKKLDSFHILKNTENLKNKDQGDLLENYVYNLFNSIKIFKYIPNQRTSVNEIDGVVELNDIGKIFKSDCFNLVPSWIPDYFLIECKNYTCKIKITYVNKFHSLLKQSSTPLGIFFSYESLTGKSNTSWKDSQGFVNKLALINSFVPKEPFIISADKNSYDYLDKNNYDFLEWITSSYTKLKVDIKKDFL